MGFPASHGVPPPGRGGSLPMESVAALPWNQRQLSPGISGSFAVEYAHVQVIDRFHVVQQAVSALDEVLRSVQKQLDPEDAKALKKLRKRWLKSSDQRNVDELIARYAWQRRFPALRETLAWVQDLR